MDSENWENEQQRKSVEKDRSEGKVRERERRERDIARITRVSSV